MDYGSILYEESKHGIVYNFNFSSNMALFCFSLLALIAEKIDYVIMHEKKGV